MEYFYRNRHFCLPPLYKDLNRNTADIAVYMIFMPSVCKVDKNHFQLRKVNQNISFVRSIINTLKYFALIHSSNGKWALVLREIDPKRRRKQHQLKFVIN